MTVAVAGRRPGRRALILLWTGWLRLVPVICGAAQMPEPEEAMLRSFDFRQREAVEGWSAWNDLEPLRWSPDGMELILKGPDPYCGGPALALPRRVPVWLELRLWSEEGGVAQVFYFRDQAREEDSVRFEVPAGQWHEVRLPLGPWEPEVRLRFDPPGSRGRCVLAWLKIRERQAPVPPAWPRPSAPELVPAVVGLEDGLLRLRHGAGGWGDFELWVDNARMASGHPRALVGYQRGGQAVWMPLNQVGQTRVERVRPGWGWRAPGGTGGAWAGLRVRTEWTDPAGAHWVCEQTFVPTGWDAFRVAIRLVCDRDRLVLHCPLLWLVLGQGSFGERKQQGLLAGLEYLEDEPSSSTADLLPPASNRQVPDLMKLTLPLTILVAEDRYLGVVWERGAEDVAVVFDSPDRFFGSGAHLMGWIFPGSDGRIRDESSLLPHAPVALRADQPVEWRGWILGGRGRTVVPGLQHVFRLVGWPAPPDPGLGARDYYRLAARGWLDSPIRVGDLYRHAVWPGFGPQPAADAAWTLLWLAGQVGDEGLRRRCLEAAEAAVARVPIHELNHGQIGHVRRPLPALVFGHVLANVHSTAERARQILGQFHPDGSLPYVPRPGGPDFARTHWAREANGYMAERVCELLEAAIWSGEEDLIRAALEKLRVLDDRFPEGVPRGAQTWEIPLHTPDILAAAHLVRAFVLGYELSGNPVWLDRARYWAWTGVPFVYLSQPVPGRIGLYGTIPVLGATGWRDPVWLGRPVQWCGLVYADALGSLADHDPEGPWARLAQGIAWSGVQQTWPDEDPGRGGLLPDYFLLREQRRDGPAINPATVLLPAMRAYGAPAAYTRKVLRAAGLRLHVPGTVEGLEETGARVVLLVRPWLQRRCWVLVNGCRQVPKVWLNGRSFNPLLEQAYETEGGRVVLPVEGLTQIELEGF